VCAFGIGLQKASDQRRSGFPERDCFTALLLKAPAPKAGRSLFEKGVFPMDWLDETKQKLRRHNQILFSRENPLLTELFPLPCAAERRTVVLWAFSLAEETVQALRERHPDVPCAQDARRPAIPSTS